MKPYYDNVTQCYKNILVLNKEPVGPLKTIIKRINPSKLSDINNTDYTYNTCCDEPKCIYAICDINNYNQLMHVDDISNLFEYLINHGYTVDTSITNMFQKSSVKLSRGPMICFISYKN